MNKRTILKNIPKQEVQEEVEEPEQEIEPEFNEEEVFRLPDKKEEITPEIEIEKPKKKRGNYNYDALAKGREIARLNKLKKTKERLELAEKEKEMKEQLQYQRLQEKYGKIKQKEIKPVEPEPEPEIISEPTSIPTEPIVNQRQQPYKHVDSIASNSLQTVVDYDRIINGLAERMERKHLSDREVQQKMATEHIKERDLYKDKYNSLQRQETINVLTRRNPVFERTNNLRANYTSRFNRGWYQR